MMIIDVAIKPNSCGRVLDLVRLQWEGEGAEDCELKVSVGRATTGGGPNNEMIILPT